jgi:hypothetical protein
VACDGEVTLQIRDEAVELISSVTFSKVSGLWGPYAKSEKISLLSSVWSLQSTNWGCLNLHKLPSSGLIMVQNC